MSVSVNQPWKDDRLAERFGSELGKPLDDFSLTTDANYQIVLNRDGAILDRGSRTGNEPTRRLDLIHFAVEGSCRAALELFALLSAL